MLQDFRTTLRLLQQTGGSPDRSLEEYMRSFKILSSIEEIAHYPNLRLRHVLDLFERVEDSLHEVLILKTGE